MKTLLALVVFLAAVAESLETGGGQNVNELTDATFNSFLSVSKLAIVDFYAPWCPHCQKFAPIYKGVAKKAQSLRLDVFFAKVNCAATGKSVCKTLNVRFLPTVRVFHDGKPLGDYNGEMKEGALLEFLQKASSSPNELKLTMSDAINNKIPSDVTPWNPEKAKHN
ncbi:probable protein disulfide-isomerase ER-60 [Porites lutea]|uniref:probable protein disulfide-isomerase ER-60 n=1 Tax=Porites lutea TaxID=51062 RepID=UPI003CC64664